MATTASAAEANRTADTPDASLDENVRPRGVHPARLQNPDAFLGLLRDVGLSPRNALLAHAELGVKLFGFALLVDYRAPDDVAPMPAEWLAAHPDLPVPHLAEALSIPAPTPDEFFAHLVDTVILGIRHAVSGPATRTSDPRPGRPAATPWSESGAG